MRELIEQIQSFQNLLISQATGHGQDNDEYIRMREALTAHVELKSQMPEFIRTCRDLNQFWQFIKHKFSTYAERQTYLWNEFRPILEHLENAVVAPSDKTITLAIEKFDAEHVQEVWLKALERRASDPEGAITLARTLLESVCKHILEETQTSYACSPDINKLYRLTAEQLNIAPSQHTEKVFKQILGGCTAVVEGLGSLRNSLSDSHGKGKVAIK
ncbi:MAG: abortive infection family protein, partial [Burkholderiales bacterium]